MVNRNNVMKYLMLFTWLCVAFFSCSIEKRRYFDGYYLSIRQAQGPPIRQAQGPPIRQAQGPPIRQAQGPGKGEGAQEQRYAVSDASNNEKSQGVDIVTTEKKIASQNEVVVFDHCLDIIDIDFVRPSLDMLAPPIPARVSERLDSADTKINWRKIVVEHQRQVECDFLYNKLINRGREPLLGSRISNFFLSGISAVVLGALFFGLGVYGNPIFKGLEILGILIGITGIVFIVFAVIGYREIDKTRLRSTPKKFDMSSGDFRSF
jgi:hypothetical protein